MKPKKHGKKYICIKNVLTNLEFKKQIIQGYESKVANFEIDLKKN